MFLPRSLPEEDLARVRGILGAASWAPLRGQRVFITGGTGFVGKWLVATLLDANRHFELGCEMVLLSRNPDAFAAAAPDLVGAANVQLVRGDVRNFVFPDGKFGCVVHAATDVVAQGAPQQIFDTCVNGTKRALEFAAQAEASSFLLVSSGAVYGRQPPALERLGEGYAGAPDPLLPSSAYGEGKRVSEWLACAHAAQTGLSVKIARCFAFVGPYLPLDKHFAIGNFLRDAMAGQPIIIQGDGTPYRTYMHAADMAAWLWAILLRGRPAAAYNVGGDEAVSIAELARRVVGVLGANSDVTTLKTAPVGQPSERYVPDTYRIRAELSLPEPLSLDESIARTARWHSVPSIPA